MCKHEGIDQGGPKIEDCIMGTKRRGKEAEYQTTNTQTYIYIYKQIYTNMKRNNGRTTVYQVFRDK